MGHLLLEDLGLVAKVSAYDAIHYLFGEGSSFHGCKVFLCDAVLIFNFGVVWFEFMAVFAGVGIFSDT